MGDVSNSVSDFGYPFETSHAKGHQDDVAANLKSKATMSVIRRKHVIQADKDLFNFAQKICSFPYQE